MTTDFPTAPSAYGLNGPSAHVTVEKSLHASHTEILTPPVPAMPPEFVQLLLAAAAPVLGDIRIEIRRGNAAIKVDWPVQASGDCAT